MRPVMGCQSAFSHTVSISILVLLSTEGLLWSTLRHSYFGYRYPWGTGFILKDDTEHIMTHHLDIFQTTTHACISIKMGQSLFFKDFIQYLVVSLPSFLTYLPSFFFLHTQRDKNEVTWLFSSWKYRFKVFIVRKSLIVSSPMKISYS